jgi:hypothetical protein
MSKPCQADFLIPTTDIERVKIVNGIWQRPPSLRLRQADLDWDAYFEYYFNQCEQASHSDGKYISARSHQDIIEISQKLEELRTEEEIKQHLRLKLTKQWSPEEEEVMLQGSVNLAARLLTMMDIGKPHLAFSGRSVLEWDKGSLKDFVHSYFNELPVLPHDDVKMDAIFTGRNLGRIAGIEIEWTDNLADHLRIVDDSNNKVAIFHHASFLKWQQR